MRAIVGAAPLGVESLSRATPVVLYLIFNPASADGHWLEYYARKRECFPSSSGAFRAWTTPLAGDSSTWTTHSTERGIARLLPQLDHGAAGHDEPKSA
jgi:hypothetical protein